MATIKHKRADVIAKLAELKSNSPRYTDADRERAIDLLLEGKNFQEMADDIGCTPATAEKWCNDYVEAGEDEDEE